MAQKLLGKHLREMIGVNEELLAENKALEEQNTKLKATVQSLISKDIEVKPKKRVRLFGDPIVEVKW